MPINLDCEHIQRLIYSKLSVAGHLTIFLSRKRGSFWSYYARANFLLAVCGTQLVATVIAIYGLFMFWGWTVFVWSFALVWFLVNDRV